MIAAVATREGLRKESFFETSSFPWRAFVNSADFLSNPVKLLSGSVGIELES